MKSPEVVPIAIESYIMIGKITGAVNGAHLGLCIPEIYAPNLKDPKIVVTDTVLREGIDLKFGPLRVTPRN